MNRRKQVVWVAMHYEIMGRPESPYIDSVQFHVSSSFAHAERYIRAMGVDSHSWWQVHPHAVDCPPDLDEGDTVHFFSHRGTRLKAAPLRRAMAEFQKHVIRNPDIYGPRSSDGA
jgi:hypothetical protein